MCCLADITLLKEIITTYIIFVLCYHANFTQLLALSSAVVAETLA